MNPFEQLRLLDIDPRQKFEDVAISILRETLGNIRRVRVHRGDGGVDGFSGTYGDQGEVEVYQVKYFPDPWGDSQREQFRESFKRASESADFRMKAWTLCVPARLTKDDLRYFDSWAAKQTVPCKVLDADDLTDLLKRDECAAIRREMSGWGVRGLHAGGPQFSAQLVVQTAKPRSGQDALLALRLTNNGVVSASELRVEIWHTETNCQSLYHNEEAWQANDGMVNPRTLRGLRPLNPDEPCPILRIPVCPQTPFPFQVRMRIWAKDSPSTEMHIVVSREQMVSGARISFERGPLRAESATPCSTSRAAPSSQAGKQLLEEMLANMDSGSPGLREILDTGPFGPLVIAYLPHLQGGGGVRTMKKSIFRDGIAELVDLGWLANPEEDETSLVYEFIPE